MRMNALDQTPVSPGTFGRCVVCSVGAAEYRDESTPDTSGLRAAGNCGRRARTAGTGVKVRAVCRSDGRAVPHARDLVRDDEHPRDLPDGPAHSGRSGNLHRATAQLLAR